MLNCNMFKCAKIQDYYSTLTNKQILIEDIKNANSIINKSLQTNDLNIIYEYYNQIGKNYLFLKEFIVISILFMEKLCKIGTKEHIFYTQKILKDIFKYYANTPYLYYIIYKIFQYIKKNNFINFETELISLIENMKFIISEIYNDSLDEDIKISLKKIHYELSSIRVNTMILSIINNLDKQILLAINLCQAILIEKTSDEMKITVLLILITCYKVLELDDVKDHYIQKLYSYNSIVANNILDLILAN